MTYYAAHDAWKLRRLTWYGSVFWLEGRAKAKSLDKRNGRFSRHESISNSTKVLLSFSWLSPKYSFLPRFLMIAASFNLRAIFFNLNLLHFWFKRGIHLSKSQCTNKNIILYIQNETSKNLKTLHTCTLGSPSFCLF